MCALNPLSVLLDFLDVDFKLHCVGLLAAADEGHLPVLAASYARRVKFHALLEVVLVTIICLSAQVYLSNSDAVRCLSGWHDVSSHVWMGAALVVLFHTSLPP